MSTTTAAAIRVGLIGAAIQASRSPAMHMREAAALGLSLSYELFDLDRLGGPAAVPELLDTLEAAGFAGVNVTHPCKQEVVAHLHSLSEDARRLGAVNTVVFAGGHRAGHNTDWLGFAEGMRRSLPDVRLNEVTQLGAGGAGSATAYALLKLGAAHVQIYDVAASRAVQLSERLQAQFPPGRLTPVSALSEALARSDGLVNATPIGMREYPGLPLPEQLLRPALWVAEVVYFPLETTLLRVARERGCRSVDGGDMAVLQAAAAFELFTGRVPDRERMIRGFRDGLARERLAASSAT